MSGKQVKQYRAGQKLPASQGQVKSAAPEGRESKTQGGKTHKVKNRSINHGRSR